MVTLGAMHSWKFYYVVSLDDDKILSLLHYSIAYVAMWQVYIDRHFFLVLYKVVLLGPFNVSLALSLKL